MSSTAPTNLAPTEVYGNKANILLRIGNGGAGQSGLVKALADAFIAAQGGPAFGVAWYKADTTGTLGYLKTADIDVGLTYNAAAEKQALSEAYADTRAYAFRDHFRIVGPKSDPAKLLGVTDALVAFQKLYAAAVSDPTGAIRFLSRFDKSATNIKETSLWAAIGQVPWAIPYSTWYHAYIDFPVQALTAAASLMEYTLTDRGTWLTVYPDDSKATLAMLLEGKDGDDDRKEDQADPLLNPCHALVSTKTDSAHQKMAKDFVAYLASPPGQDVIARFTNGTSPVPLYSKAP
jgi:ABC-type tungstate transport system permease subunit